MKVCIKCNTINDDNEEYCTNCGAKLPMPMLAIVCPNCGKVNALGTTECPICHHKLTGIRPEKVMPSVKPPKQNKKLLRFLAVFFGLLGVVIFIFLSQRYTSAYNYTEYMGVKLVYYDQDLHSQAQAYYVIKGGHKQPPKDKPFTLDVAYLGNQKSDQKKFGSCSSRKLAKLYDTHRHYKLHVQAKATEFSGPLQTVISVKQAILLSNGKTPISGLEGHYPVKVATKPTIKYIKILEIVPNSL